MSDLVKIKRSELYEKVWNEPISHIAKLLSVHPKMIADACARHNIPRPSKSYWSLSEADREPVAPLPDMEEDEMITLFKIQRRYRFNESGLTKKANISCIFRVLELKTDANKDLSTNEIIEEVYSAYQLQIDRRTVYAAIDILQRLGYNIACENYRYRLLMSNKSYLPDRTFDPDEVQALLSSIKLNPMLPLDEERALYYKTKRLMPKHNCANLQNVLTEADKKEIPAVFYGNVNEINIAMVNRQKISFTYMKYSPNGKLTKMYENTFVLSPVRYRTVDLVTYLLCADDRKNQYQFRVDRMADVQALDEKQPDVHQLIPGVTDMDGKAFFGKLCPFRIICEDEIATDTVDYFGKKAKLTPNQDGTFTVTHVAGFHKVLTFALHYADKCEVTEPKEIRDAVIGKIKNNKYGL